MRHIANPVTATGSAEGRTRVRRDVVPTGPRSRLGKALCKHSYSKAVFAFFSITTALPFAVTANKNGK